MTLKNFINDSLKSLAVVLMLCVSVAQAETGNNEHFYKIHKEPMTAVAEARDKALENEQLLLLVIGANWCHDSDALSAHFSDIQHADVLKHHFVMETVNAQWLDNLSGLLGQYGHPGYFGTPTLLIIDPQSKQVMNRDSVQRWQSAHGESATSLERYLSLQVEASDAWQPQTIPAELIEYEKSQTNRLYKAYEIIGPLLKDEVVNGNKGPLDELWNEVRRFRYQLQHDLVEAHNNQLDSYPVYQALSFESK